MIVRAKGIRFSVGVELDVSAQDVGERTLFKIAGKPGSALAERRLILDQQSPRHQKIPGEQKGRVVVVEHDV
jgi:hypothetical protein